MHGGTTRSGFFCDGKLKSDDRPDDRHAAFAHEVWRWDDNQSYPDFDTTRPVTDERVKRREFEKKCYFDHQGAIFQLLRQCDLILARMKIYRKAEEQKERYERDGAFHLQPGEEDLRDKLKQLSNTFLKMILLRPYHSFKDFSNC